MLSADMERERERRRWESEAHDKRMTDHLAEEKRRQHKEVRGALRVTWAKFWLLTFGPCQLLAGKTPADSAQT